MADRDEVQEVTDSQEHTGNGSPVVDDDATEAHIEAEQTSDDPVEELVEKVDELVEIELWKQERKKKKKEKKAKKKAKKDQKGELEIGTKRGIETMFRTSYRQHVDLSGLADNKANIMISINGIMISILIASISPKVDSNAFLILPTSVLLLACLISLVFAILSARPRVSSEEVTLEDVREERANILFFGNFVNMRPDDYLQGMKELVVDADGLYISMMKDIYSLGGVLAKKFRLLRIAYTVFMIGLALGVILFIGVYIYITITDPGAVDLPIDTGDSEGPLGS